MPKGLGARLVARAGNVHHRRRRHELSRLRSAGRPGEVVDLEAPNAADDSRRSALGMKLAGQPVLPVQYCQVAGDGGLRHLEQGGRFLHGRQDRGSGEVIDLLAPRVCVPGLLPVAVVASSGSYTDRLGFPRLNHRLRRQVHPPSQAPA